MSVDIEWISGVVLDVMPKGLYRVRCADGREVIAGFSTESRYIGVAVVPGDAVEIQKSRLNPNRGKMRCL